MTIRHALGLSVAACAVVFVAAGPASALSVKECSAKYATAKAGGTLAGKSWNDFRKTECAAATPAAAAPAPAKPAAAAAPAPAAKPAAAPAPVSVGNAVFPGKIDGKYASLKAGKAREMTCLDQYKANKATGGNGSLKWIQKGGGYYSVCNKRLKG